MSETLSPEDQADLDAAVRNEEDEADADLDAADVDNADAPLAAEPPPPVSEKEWEARIEKATKEASRHAGRIGEIFAEDAQDFQVCPLCSPIAPGFLTPGELHDAGKAPVLALLGATDSEAYKTEDGALSCETCNALGKVLTGSKVPEHVTKLCPTCSGTGWTNAAQRAAEATARNAAASFAASQQGAPQAPAFTPTMPATDPHGRPAGHEFYGRMPFYMSDDEKARDLPGIHG